MAEIVAADGHKLTRDEQIEVLVTLGMTREYATFVIAMEAGEVDGDVVIVDEDGNEIKREPSR
jgi:hypothetical protein